MMHYFQKLRRTCLKKVSERKFPQISFKNPPFAIIGIPGSLCEVSLCLRFVPDDQPIFFVANGLDPWELQWAKSNLKFDGFLEISSILPHGDVIDLLLHGINEPFGIMDYDCIILNPSYFSKLWNLTNNTLVNAIFGQKNRELELDIPETFIMFLNAPIIRQICNSYQVDSNLTYYSKLNKKVKSKLHEIGIDRTHLPESFKDYIDTAKLWIALGLAENYQISFIDRHYTLSEDFVNVFHAGAGNKTNRINSLWNVRGTYFWRRTLETCNDRALQKRYYQKYGNLKSEVIPQMVPDLCKQIVESYFEAVEKIINYA